MSKRKDERLDGGAEEYGGLLCDACGEIIDEDEAVWIDDPEKEWLSTPYHPDCAPPEKKTPKHEFRPLCAECGEVASTFLLFKRLGKWRLVFEGSAAGTGSSGDEIPETRARAIIAGFTEPYSPQRIRAAGFFDDGGYCLECCQFYCSRHWHISTTGGGRCPKGHFKSLDPHWSPDDDDF